MLNSLSKYEGNTSLPFGTLYGTGGLNLSSPTGGSAKGMPEKEAYLRCNMMGIIFTSY